MCPFMGGSAPAMANQIVEGYTLLTAVQLKRVTDPELELLQFEVDKIQRELRSQTVAQDDIQAIQARSRKLARITGAMQQLQATRAKRKRHA